jgi:aspartate racemase
MSSVKATPSVPVSYSVATDASLRIEPDKTDWSRAQQQSDAYRNGQGTVSFTPLPGSGQSWGGAVPVFSSSATSGGGNPASAAGFTGASLTFSTTGASTLSSLFASGSSSLPQTRPFAAAGVRGDAAGQATSTGSGTSALNYLLNHGGSGLQASAQPYLAASMYGPQPGVLVAGRLTDGAKWLYEKTGGDKGPLGWAKPYAKPVIQNLDRHVVTPAAQQVRKLLPRGPTPAKPMSASPYGNATNNPNFGYGSWRGDSVPRGNPANSAPRAGSGGTPYGPQAAPPQPVQAKLNGQRVYVDPISKKVIGDANGRPVTPQSPEQYVKQQQAQRYQPVGTKTVNGGGATVQVSKDSKTGDYLVKTSGGTRKLRDLTGSNDVRSLDKVHVDGAVAKDKNAWETLSDMIRGPQLSPEQKQAAAQAHSAAQQKRHQEAVAEWERFTKDPLGSIGWALRGQAPPEARAGQGTAAASLKPAGKTNTTSWVPPGMQLASKGFAQQALQDLQDSKTGAGATQQQLNAATPGSPGPLEWDTNALVANRARQSPSGNVAVAGNTVITSNDANGALESAALSADGMAPVLPNASPAYLKKAREINNARALQAGAEVAQAVVGLASRPGSTRPSAASKTNPSYNMSWGEPTRTVPKGRPIAITPQVGRASWAPVIGEQPQPLQPAATRRPMQERMQDDEPALPRRANDDTPKALRSREMNDRLPAPGDDPAMNRRALAPVVRDQQSSAALSMPPAGPAPLVSKLKAPPETSATSALQAHSTRDGGLQTRKPSTLIAPYLQGNQLTHGPTPLSGSTTSANSLFGSAGPIDYSGDYSGYDYAPSASGGTMAKPAPSTAHPQPPLPAKDNGIKFNGHVNTNGRFELDLPPPPLKNTQANATAGAAPLSLANASFNPPSDVLPSLSGVPGAYSAAPRPSRQSAQQAQQAVQYQIDNNPRLQQAIALQLAADDPQATEADRIRLHNEGKVLAMTGGGGAPPSGKPARAWSNDYNQFYRTLLDDVTRPLTGELKNPQLTPQRRTQVLKAIGDLYTEFGNTLMERSQAGFGGPADRPAFIGSPGHVKVEQRIDAITREFGTEIKAGRERNTYGASNTSDINVTRQLDAVVNAVSGRRNARAFFDAVSPIKADGTRPAVHFIGIAQSGATMASVVANAARQSGWGTEIPGHLGYLIPSQRAPGAGGRARDFVSTLDASQVKPGDTVVLVDDTITTGTSVETAIAALDNQFGPNLNIELVTRKPPPAGSFPTAVGDVRLWGLQGDTPASSGKPRANQVFQPGRGTSNDPPRQSVGARVKPDAPSVAAWPQFASPSLPDAAIRAGSSVLSPELRRALEVQPSRGARAEPQQRFAPKDIEGLTGSPRPSPQPAQKAHQTVQNQIDKHPLVQQAMAQQLALDDPQATVAHRDRLLAQGKVVGMTQGGGTPPSSSGGAQGRADHSILTRSVLGARSQGDRALTGEQRVAFAPMFDALKNAGVLPQQMSAAQAEGALSGGVSKDMSVAQLEALMSDFIAKAGQQGIELNDRRYPPFVFRLKPDGSGNATFFSGKFGDVSNQTPHGNTPPTLGVYGGVGTLAGVDFVKNIVDLYPGVAQQTGRDPNAARPFDVLLLSNPATPDRSARLASPNNPDPASELQGGLKTLLSLGADKSCVACNTAHAWWDQMQSALGADAPKQMSIIDALADSLNARGIAEVAVLATEGTTNARIYQDVLSARGIHIADLTPQEVSIVHDAIYNKQDGIKAGSFEGPRQRLLEIADRYPNTMLALCCTELGLVLNAEHTPQLLQQNRLIDNNIVSPQALIRKLLDEQQPPNDPPSANLAPNRPQAPTGAAGGGVVAPSEPSRTSYPSLHSAADSAVGKANALMQQPLGDARPAQRLQSEIGALLSKVEQRRAVLGWQTSGDRAREVKRIDTLTTQRDQVRSQIELNGDPQGQLGRKVQALGTQLSQAHQRLQSLDAYIDGSTTELDGVRNRLVQAWKPVSASTGLGLPLAPIPGQGPLNAGQHAMQSLDLVGKYAPKVVAAYGAAQLGIGGLNFAQNMAPEVRNAALPKGAGAAELVKLQKDPSYVSNHYGGATQNASGDLWKDSSAGSKTQYFRRVPDDIYRDVLRTDTQAGKLAKSGDVVRTEMVDGQAVPVKIVPPYRTGAKREYFYKKQDLNPFNRTSRDRWQFGPREGWHTDVALNGFAGTQLRAPEAIFKLQFDPLLRVPYYSARVQQAQYHGVASATVVPASKSMTGLTNLTRPAGETWDSRSPVTDVDLLSTSAYLVTGERQRHELMGYPRGEVLTPALEAAGGASRSFGFVEPGVMSYFVNVGGKKPSGEPWNAGARAYFEHLIHPANFRMGTPQGGGRVAPSVNFSGGPDVALELYTRGVVPLPFSEPLAAGTAVVTLASLMAARRARGMGTAGASVGDQINAYLRSRDVAADAGGGPPPAQPPWNGITREP